MLALPFKQFSSLRLVIDTSVARFKRAEVILYLLFTQVLHAVAEEHVFKCIKWMNKTVK